MNAIQLVEKWIKYRSTTGLEEAVEFGDAMAATIRRLHAENEALKTGMAKQANAVTLMRSVVGDTAKHNAEQNVTVELSQLRSQLESEREANSQLTSENEALRKDAGRYRYLKEKIGRGYMLGNTDFCLNGDDSEAWDLTIDTAALFEPTK